MFEKSTMKALDYAANPGWSESPGFSTANPALVLQYLLERYNSRKLDPKKEIPIEILLAHWDLPVTDITAAKN